MYIRLPYTYTVDILNIPHKININPTQSSQFIQDVEKNNIHAIDIVFCHNLLRIFVLISSGRDDLFKKCMIMFYPGNNRISTNRIIYNKRRQDITKKAVFSGKGIVSTIPPTSIL